MNFITHLLESGIHLQQLNTGSAGVPTSKPALYGKYVDDRPEYDQFDNEERDFEDGEPDMDDAQDVRTDLSDSFVQWVLSNRDQIAQILSQYTVEDEEQQSEEQELPTENPEQPDFETGELDELGPDEDSENFNRQGMIRTVPGAHLVYKRQTSNGLYDELWIFNVDDTAALDEFQIRNEILRGTDIAPHNTLSDDGSQSYELWTVGNGQMMLITGLPN